MKERLHRVWLWTLDLCSASHFAMTIVHEGKDGEDIRIPVVAKTRGGEPIFQRGEGGRFGAFDLRYEDLDDENMVWRRATMKIAQLAADGYNRALSARRRTILLVIGIVSAMVARAFWGCLF